MSHFLHVLGWMPKLVPYCSFIYSQSLSLSLSLSLMLILESYVCELEDKVMQLVQKYTGRNWHPWWKTEQ